MQVQPSTRLEAALRDASLRPAPSTAHRAAAIRSEYVGTRKAPPSSESASQTTTVDGEQSLAHPWQRSAGTSRSDRRGLRRAPRVNRASRRRTTLAQARDST